MSRIQITELYEEETTDLIY